MTPDELGARLLTLLDAEVTGEASASISGGGGWSRATVDVPAADWHRAVVAARDDTDLACDFFDWLSAVDDLDAGFTVVAHLWSTTRRHGVLVRTLAERAAPSVVS